MEEDAIGPLVLIDCKPCNSTSEIPTVKINKLNPYVIEIQ